MPSLFETMRRMTIALAIGAVVLATVAGCDDVDRYKNPAAGGRPLPKVEPEPSRPTLGNEIAYGRHGAPSDTPTAIGGGGPVTDPHSDQDYIQKADIYWKFNYIKQVLESGVTPFNLDETVKELKRQAQTTTEDENKPLIRDVIKNLEDGLNAQKQEALFRAGGVDPRTVAWGSGRPAIEMQMRDRAELKRMGSPISAIPIRLTATQQAVLAYEEAHHASPDQVRRKAYSAACGKTQELAHKLGLEGRTANSPAGTATSD